MNEALMATAALAAVTPYLAELAKSSAKELGGGLGKSIWEWAKRRLTSAAGQEAVADLEKDPADPANVKAAEAALAKLLKTSPAALSELGILLERAGITGGSQSATITGSQNTIAQASGAEINVSTGQDVTKGRQR